MKRSDEELCKAQFDSFIKQFFSPQRMIWEEIPQQDEPPDYYLLLGDTKFAVEVTTLMELVSVGTLSSLPRFQIVRFFEQFVGKIEEIAKNEGYLRGYYLVSFSAPIEDFSAVHDKVRDRLLEYIRNTSHVETAPFQCLFERVVPQQRPQECGIQKLGSRPVRIVSGAPVWAKWEGEAAEGIYSLLHEILNIKMHKLADIGEPIILLLLDEYRFADRQMFEKCIHRIPSPVHFHTIFIVQGQKGGFPIYSQNRDWLITQ
jgi:hypothetical protein